MTSTDTPYKKLAAKNAAILKMREKRTNLKRQMEIFEKSLASLDEDLEKSEAELQSIQDLLGEYETLDKEGLKVSAEMNRLRIEFSDRDDKELAEGTYRPNRPIEETLGGSDYPKLKARKVEIEGRQAEIGKAVNKVYYRR